MTTHHDHHPSPYWEAKARKERDEDTRRQAELTLLEAIFSDSEVELIDRGFSLREPRSPAA